MAYDGFYPGLTTRASVNEILNTAIQAEKDIEAAKTDTLEALAEAKDEINSLGQGIEIQVQRVEQLATQTSQSAGRAELAAQTATTKASESAASAVASEAAKVASANEALKSKTEADHAKTDADYVRAVAVKGLVEEAPTDGYNYTRKSKQWVKDVKESQYIDFYMYVPGASGLVLGGPPANTIITKFYPRIALKGAILEGCYLSMTNAMTGNLTVELKDSGGAWTCTGVIPSGAREGVFTGTPGVVTSTSAIILSVKGTPPGNPENFTITLRFEVAAVSSASFP